MLKPSEMARVGVLAVTVAFVGCSEQKLAGDVDVNGRETTVTGCALSPPGAEKWVDVSTDSGWRIRIVQRPVPSGGSGTKTETIVQLAQPRNSALVDAQCRTKVTTSRSLNGRVSGSVSLGNCRAAGVVVSGKFTYGKCTQAGGRQV
jgi:hypothetical protein